MLSVEQVCSLSQLGWLMSGKSNANAMHGSGCHLNRLACSEIIVCWTNQSVCSPSSLVVDVQQKAEPTQRLQASIQAWE